MASDGETDEEASDDEEVGDEEPQPAASPRQRRTAAGSTMRLVTRPILTEPAKSPDA